MSSRKRYACFICGILGHTASICPGIMCTFCAERKRYAHCVTHTKHECEYYKSICRSPCPICHLPGHAVEECNVTETPLEKQLRELEEINRPLVEPRIFISTTR